MNNKLLDYLIVTTYPKFIKMTVQTHSPIIGENLLQDYQQVRQQTERLCAPLQPEDVVVQPIADVSPPQMAPGAQHLVF